MSDSKHVTYEDAGVDTAEGGRAVDAIKQMVKDTNRPEVIGGIGGFGGLFSAAALKDMEDPILISGTQIIPNVFLLHKFSDPCTAIWDCILWDKVIWEVWVLMNLLSPTPTWDGKRTIT